MRLSNKFTHTAQDKLQDGRTRNIRVMVMIPPEEDKCLYHNNHVLPTLEPKSVITGLNVWRD